jgi:uncharacterized membrane protein YfcA
LIIVVAGWIGYLSTQSGDAGKARNASSAPVGIRKRQVVRIVPTAFVVGIISGFFAIGGGFLVVPGLALAAAIDLRLSARCSLIPITAFAALDALEYVLGDRLPLPVVQRTFAVFLGVIAAYMVAQNI